MIRNRTLEKPCPPEDFHPRRLGHIDDRVQFALLECRKERVVVPQSATERILVEGPKIALLTEISEYEPSQELGIGVFLLAELLWQGVVEVVLAEGVEYAVDAPQPCTLPGVKKTEYVVQHLCWQILQRGST
jgi:hypothetical protein